MTRSQKTLFMLLVLGMELFFVAYNPVGGYPDELSHVQCAVWYRENGRLPDPYVDRFRLADGSRTKIQQEKHPPYAYVLGAVVLASTEGCFDDSSSDVSLPGPYELSVRPGRLDPNLRVRDGQLYVLRLISVLHLGLAAWFLLRLAGFLWPHRPRFAFAMAWIVCAVPQVALGGAAYTPDTPLVAFSVASFYYLLRSLEPDADHRTEWFAGLWLALALLAKAGAIFLLPVVAVVLLQRMRAKRKGTLRFLLAVLSPALVLAAWWYLRNLVLFGDFFQMRAQIETATHWVRREPLTGAFFEAFFEQLFRTFFGFSGVEVYLYRPLYYVLAAILGVAGLGCLLLLRRPLRAEVGERELLVLPSALVALGGLVLLTLAGNLTGFAPQGRYLFPALGACMALFGTGLGVSLRSPGDGLGWYFAAGLWYLLTAWAFCSIVLPREGVLRSRARGEGTRVLHYADCGLPGPEPRLLQGYTLPDGAQLGRVTSWRSLTGHPVAVAYRFHIPEARDLQVRVLYFNPDPRTPYVAGNEGRFAYPAQRLLANGRLVHDEIELTSTPRELVYPLPAGWVAGGELELRFEKLRGPLAMVSEIWIEEPWLEYDRASGEVQNRSRRTLPYALLFTSGGRRERLEGELGPEAHARVPAVQSDTGARLLAGRLAAFSLLEAEGRQVAGTEFFGDTTASGGYRLRGRGTLARLRFPTQAGVFLARVKSPGKDWVFRPVDGMRSGNTVEYRTPENATESLDYVLTYGAWPDG